MLFVLSSAAGTPTVSRRRTPARCGRCALRVDARGLFAAVVQHPIAVRLSRRVCVGRGGLPAPATALPSRRLPPFWSGLVFWVGLASSTCTSAALRSKSLRGSPPYHEHLGGTAKPATPLRRCSTFWGREGLAFDVPCCCQPECTHPSRGVFARPRRPPPHPSPRPAVANLLPGVPLVGHVRRRHHLLWPYPPR